MQTSFVLRIKHKNSQYCFYIISNVSSKNKNYINMINYNTSTFKSFKIFWNKILQSYTLLMIFCWDISEPIFLTTFFCCQTKPTLRPQRRLFMKISNNFSPKAWQNPFFCCVVCRNAIEARHKVICLTCGGAQTKSKRKKSWWRVHANINLRSGARLFVSCTADEKESKRERAARSGANISLIIFETTTGT